MKPSFLTPLSIATLVLGFAAAMLQAADPGPEPLKLADALKLKRGHALTVTYTKFGDGSVRKGDQQAVQLVVYSSTPDVNGDFPILTDETLVISGAGAGAGPHVVAFKPFANPGEQQGIIAILIGLLLPANDTKTAKIMPIPGTDAISAEVHDGGAGIGLLLPAVQKVREAAAR